MSKGLAIVVAVIVYYILAHIYSTAAHPGWPAVFLAAGPLLIFCGVLTWRTRHYILCALCVATLIPLWHWRDFLAVHVEWVYLMQHAGGNFALALMFGATLFAGRTPLCTEMAKLAYNDGDTGNDTMPDEVLPYTRQVTVAWTIFFCVVCATSLLLFFFTNEEIWSVFANLLTIPLVALMFVLEYLVRHIRFPHLERKGVLSAVRAYWNLETH